MKARSTAAKQHIATASLCLCGAADRNLTQTVLWQNGKTDLGGVEQTTGVESRRMGKLVKRQQQQQMLCLGVFGTGVAISLNPLKIN